MAEQAFLSKSTFIRGVQCEKSLYLHKKRPFLRDRLSAEQLAKFSRGHQIGLLARELFPGGIDVSPKIHFQMGASIQKTAEHIKAGVPVLYEAAFEYNGVRVALDILYKDKDVWKAVEVKSSAAISETYLWDASLQYFVIVNSGLPLDDFFLAYINYGYVRDGDIDMSKLFIIESVQKLVQGNQAAVEEKIEQLREVSKLTKSPNIPVGPHCHNPYPCDFIGHCWKHLPPETGFDESSLHKESAQLCGEALREPAGVLSSLYYSPAIPPYNGCSPYQKLPFSYGHGLLNENNGTATVLNALPGKAFSMADVALLLDELKQYGSIHVFDRDAEVERLANLVKGDALLKGRLAELAQKMIDIQAPFANSRDSLFRNKLPLHPEEAVQILTSNHGKTTATLKTRLEVSLWYEALPTSINTAVWHEGIKEMERFHVNSLSVIRELCQAMKEL